jgi:CTP:molybdopterin cytidylyltransferase MocA
MDAIVVAGGTPGPDDPLYPLTQGRPKALLELEGHPMVQWVLDALEGADRVEHVILIGPGPEDGLHLGAASTFIPDQGAMIANVRAGLQAVRRINPAATHILLASGDIPSITPEMVDWRVQTVEASDADIDYAVVDRRVMDRVFPGSRRSFTRLKDAEVCGGDLNGVRVTVSSDDGLWDALYAARKNALKQAALVGFDVLFLAALRQLSLEAAAVRVGRHLRLKAHITLCPYAEIGMDVDKPHQYEMVRQYLRARSMA